MDTGNLTAVVQVQAKATQSPTGVAGNKPKWSENATAQLRLTYGVGDGNLDWLVFQPRELAASASETLALDGTDLANIFNATNANGFTKVMAVMVFKVANVDASTPGESITVGAAGLSPLAMNLGGTSPTYTVWDGGLPAVFSKPAGFTVDGSNFNLKIANDDATNKSTYTLVIGGVKE